MKQKKSKNSRRKRFHAPIIFQYPAYDLVSQKSMKDLLDKLCKGDIDYLMVPDTIKVICPPDTGKKARFIQQRLSQ